MLIEPWNTPQVSQLCVDWNDKIRSIFCGMGQERVESDSWPKSRNPFTGHVGFFLRLGVAKMEEAVVVGCPSLPQSMLPQGLSGGQRFHF